ncbi:MAG: TetR/AcrR family transcriptional regulator [Acutalibacteraceae bacterium]
MSTKEYSCVKRTKKAFEKSLVELSKDLPLNKITVKMLCEKAELSRNAFYFHYKDINDLISDIEDTIVKEAENLIVTLKDIGFPKNVYATVEGLVDLLDENKDTCIMLFDKTSDSFTHRMSKLFCDFNYEYFKQYHKTKNRTNYDFFYMFISTGFYGALRYWFLNYESISKGEITALIYVLIKRLLIPGNPEINDEVFGKKVN